MATGQSTEHSPDIMETFTYLAGSVLRVRTQTNAAITVAEKGRATKFGCHFSFKTLEQFSSDNKLSGFKEARNSTYTDLELFVLAQLSRNTRGIRHQMLCMNDFLIRHR